MELFESLTLGKKGPWETLDLRSQIKKIEDSNSSTRRTSKLIRLIKKWQEYKEASVKSREIEKAVLGFFGQGKKEERAVLGFSARFL